MKIGRIVGEVTSTINHPFYDSRKQLIVDLLKIDGTSSGDYVVAVDLVGAGPGETVLILDEGNSSRQILRAENAPIRTVVAGIIDHIEQS